MGQRVVIHYPMVSPEVPTTLMNPYIYPMSKNNQKLLKTGFDDTYLHNFLFHTEITFMGQKVVFNYPLVSPKVPTTIMTPNSYPMGHYNHSFVSKNGQELFKTGF
jgi:hypothetical protein